MHELVRRPFDANDSCKPHSFSENFFDGIISELHIPFSVRKLAK